MGYGDPENTHREWESADGSVCRSGNGYGGSDRTKVSATDSDVVEGGLAPSLRSNQQLLARKLNGLNRLYICVYTYTHKHTHIFIEMHTCIYPYNNNKRKDHEFAREHVRNWDGVGGVTEIQGSCMKSPPKSVKKIKLIFHLPINI